jgi:hypothetical protein
MNTITETRAVYLIHEGGDVPVYVLCDQCVAETADPAAAMADVVDRDDSRHCVGCDYHADPACDAGSWCVATRVDLNAEDDLVVEGGPGWTGLDGTDEAEVSLRLAEVVDFGDTVASVILDANGRQMAVELTLDDVLRLIGALVAVRDGLDR